MSDAANTRQQSNYLRVHLAGQVVKSGRPRQVAVLAVSVVIGDAVLTTPLRVQSHQVSTERLVAPATIRVMDTPPTIHLRGAAYNTNVA